MRRRGLFFSLFKATRASMRSLKVLTPKPAPFNNTAYNSVISSISSTAYTMGAPTGCGPDLKELRESFDGGSTWDGWSISEARVVVEVEVETWVRGDVAGKRM